MTLDTTNQKTATLWMETPLDNGGWLTFLVQFPFVLFPAYLAWGPPYSMPVATVASNNKLSHGSTLESGQPGSSSVQG